MYAIFKVQQYLCIGMPTWEQVDILNISTWSLLLTVGGDRRISYLSLKNCSIQSLVSAYLRNQNLVPLTCCSLKTTTMFCFFTRPD